MPRKDAARRDLRRFEDPAADMRARVAAVLALDVMRVAADVAARLEERHGQTDP